MEFIDHSSLLHTRHLISFGSQGFIIRFGSPCSVLVPCVRLSKRKFRTFSVAYSHWIVEKWRNFVGKFGVNVYFRVRPGRRVVNYVIRWVRLLYFAANTIRDDNLSCDRSRWFPSPIKTNESVIGRERSYRYGGWWMLTNFGEASVPIKIINYGSISSAGERIIYRADGRWKSSTV